AGGGGHDAVDGRADIHALVLVPGLGLVGGEVRDAGRVERGEVRGVEVVQTQVGRAHAAGVHDLDGRELGAAVVGAEDLDALAGAGVDDHGVHAGDILE